MCCNVAQETLGAERPNSARRNPRFQTTLPFKSQNLLACPNITATCCPSSPQVCFENTVMTSVQWQTANGAKEIHDLTKPFTIEARAKTDIWRPSAEDDVFNAPYIYKSVQVSSFKQIRVTVSGDWKTQFDQGGLFLSFPFHDGPIRWIKAGIEYFEGQPVLGVVGTDRFSDWSLCPMGKGERKATFELRKEGSTLWVYVVVNESRQPLREIKWAFIDSESQSNQQVDMHVGVYAAKPTADKGNAEAPIEVLFEDLLLEIT